MLNEQRKYYSKYKVGPIIKRIETENTFRIRLFPPNKITDNRLLKNFHFDIEKHPAR